MCFSSKSTTTTDQNYKKANEARIFQTAPFQNFMAGYMNQYSPQNFAETQQAADINPLTVEAAARQEGILPVVSSTMQDQNQIAQEGLSQADINRFSKMYASNVINPQLDVFNQQNQQALSNINGKAAIAGGIRNSTVRGAMNDYYGQVLPGQNLTIAQLRDQQNRQAIDAAGRNANLRLAGAQGVQQGAQTASGLAQTQFNMGDAMRNAGIQRLMIPYQLYNQALPGLNAFTNAGGWNEEGTSHSKSTTENSPSLFSSILGTLGTIGSAFSGMPNFFGSTSLGTTTGPGGWQASTTKAGPFGWADGGKVGEEGGGMPPSPQVGDVNHDGVVDETDRMLAKVQKAARQLTAMKKEASESAKPGKMEGGPLGAASYNEPPPEMVGMDLDPTVSTSDRRPELVYPTEAPLGLPPPPPPERTPLPAPIEGIAYEDKPYTPPADAGSPGIMGAANLPSQYQAPGAPRLPLPPPPEFKRPDAPPVVTPPQYKDLPAYTRPVVPGEGNNRRALDGIPILSGGTGREPGTWGRFFEGFSRMALAGGPPETQRMAGAIDTQHNQRLAQLNQLREGDKEMFDRDITMQKLQMLAAQANNELASKRYDAERQARNDAIELPNKQLQTMVYEDTLRKSQDPYHAYREREMVADRLGLTGLERDEFVATGDFPKRGKTPDTALDTALATGTAKDMLSLRDGITANRDKLTKLDQMEKLASDPNLYQGSLANYYLQAQKLGVMMGIPGLTDKVAAAETFNALNNQFALELRNPAGGAGMPGSLSDSDRRFLTESTSGLTNTRAGNLALIKMMKEQAAYKNRASQAELDFIYKTKTTNPAAIQEYMDKWHANQKTAFSPETIAEARQAVLSNPKATPKERAYADPNTPTVSAADAAAGNINLPPDVPFFLTEDGRLKKNPNYRGAAAAGALPGDVPDLFLGTN